ncbi:hypothetical protein SGUI_0725 [Serinicoccus hydrothermalis]|uniref:DUF1468 domain-containing protein n=1 Tax=Serinicoccus hydrothermalis TaxID=1758689 RepID=A0A1B1N9N9_9MICO|nr:tripartite tricarboxylate transporter TctB family protein [Serinicoccus hydrothermalis]ANS78121.1 hypothetical protein SGUI_0725 [Serinicoccus hydrothermalis]
MKNLITGVLLLALVASFWVQRAYRFPHTNLLPDAVMVVLAVLSVWLLVSGWRTRQDPEEHEEEALTWADLGRAVLLLAAWVVALPWLGFVLAGIVGGTVVSLSMRTGRPTVRQVLLDTAVNAAVVLLVYLAFTQVLYVRLPQLGGM